VVWRGVADEVLLACSADLLPPTLKRLSMFVLRAKCKLSDASADRPLWGLAGTGISRLAGRCRARRCLGQRQPGHRPGDPPARCGTARRVPRWPVGRLTPRRRCRRCRPMPGPALEVRSGVPRVVAATVEQFVPQMVNLELVGGVNFQKGCYPGPGDRGAQPVPRHAQAPQPGGASPGLVRKQPR
jgi:folate-binding Fe-S cluster repair protein YgfZ